MKIKINLDNTSSDFAKEVEKRSGIKVKECYQCGKCTAGCPVAYEMDYMPNQIIRLVQIGARREALTSRTIWLCASCITCSTRCPKEVKIAELMDVLREMALEENLANPLEKNITAFHESFLNSVKKHGRISEVWMLNEYKMKRPKTALQDLAVAPHMIAKGKLSFLPHDIKGKDAIARIFKKCKPK
ncbi:MAG: 4Fe-4S dicluster domain-containing protein [Candidatus Scalindua sp.]|nr:4Fe-4S dicluster domain-containing protein [Candidatus Scalindua sp.]